jgi:hypothetical protein
LVNRGYLSSIPPDPFQANKIGPPDWAEVTITRQARWTDNIAPFNHVITVSTGVLDVRSKNTGSALNGSRYSDW